MSAGVQKTLVERQESSESEKRGREKERERESEREWGRQKDNN